MDTIGAVIVVLAVLAFLYMLSANWGGIGKMLSFEAVAYQDRMRLRDIPAPMSKEPIPTPAQVSAWRRDPIVKAPSRSGMRPVFLPGKKHPRVMIDGEEHRMKRSMCARYLNPAFQ